MIKTKFYARSDVDDNNIRADFNNSVDAIAYASGFSPMDKVYVDEVLVDVDDESGEILRELEHEKIWSFEDLPIEDAFDVQDWPGYVSDEAGEMTLDTDFDVKDIHETLEAREELVECQHCFDLFPKEECTKIEYGYLCPHCHSLVVKEIEIPSEMIDHDVPFELEFPEPHKFDDDGDEDEIPGEYTEIPAPETDVQEFTTADDEPAEAEVFADGEMVGAPAEVTTIETPVAFADIPVTVEGGLEDGSSDDSSDDTIEEGYTGNPAERTTHLEYTDDDPTNGEAVLPKAIEKQLTESLEEHVQDRPAPIEDTTVLHGVDNAVVDCKKYTLAAHCEDEKPVDCKLEKPALEKPLAGDKVDIDLYEGLEQELIDFAASLPEELTEDILDEGKFGAFLGKLFHTDKSKIRKAYDGSGEGKGYKVIIATKDGWKAEPEKFNGTTIISTLDEAEGAAKKISTNKKTPAGEDIKRVAIVTNEGDNSKTIIVYKEGKEVTDNIKDINATNKQAEKDKKTADDLGWGKEAESEPTDEPTAATETSASDSGEEHPEEAHTDDTAAEVAAADGEIFADDASSKATPAKPKNDAANKAIRIRKVLKELGVSEDKLTTDNIREIRKYLFKEGFDEAYADIPFDSEAKEGDKIRIIHLEGEGSEYDGKEGEILHIDSIGQLHGTWGGLAVIPGVDQFEVITENLKEDVMSLADQVGNRCLDFWESQRNIGRDNPHAMAEYNITDPEEYADYVIKNIFTVDNIYDSIKDKVSGEEKEIKKLIKAWMEDSLEFEVESLTESKKARVADVEYNDNNGYDQHVLVYAGDLDEDELTDAMYDAGYIYCYVNEIFEKEISGNHDILDVLEILDESLKEDADTEAIIDDSDIKYSFEPWGYDSFKYDKTRNNWFINLTGVPYAWDDEEENYFIEDSYSIEASTLFDTLLTKDIIGDENSQKVAKILDPKYTNWGEAKIADINFLKSLIIKYWDVANEKYYEAHKNNHDKEILGVWASEAVFKDIIRKSKERLEEAKKDDELPADPGAVKVEVHGMLNDLVADEIEAIDGYEAVKTELADKPIEHKDEIVSTLDHIKDEEKEHIDELINAASAIPFEKPGTVEELEEASSAEKRAFKDGGQAAADYLDGKAIARIKDKDMRDAAIALKKANASKDALNRFVGNRKETQAEFNFDKKQQAMANAGYAIEEDLHKNEEALVAEWARQGVETGMIFDESDYAQFAKICEVEGIKPSEDLFKHYFKCIDDLVGVKEESLEFTCDQDLEDDRFPGWDEEPELEKPVDGDEVRKHEKAINESLTKAQQNFLDYVEAAIRFHTKALENAKANNAGEDVIAAIQRTLDGCYQDKEDFLKACEKNEALEDNPLLKFKLKPEYAADMNTSYLEEVWGIDENNKPILLKSAPVTKETANTVESDLRDFMFENNGLFLFDHYGANKDKIQLLGWNPELLKKLAGVEIIFDDDRYEQALQNSPIGAKGLDAYDISYMFETESLKEDTDVDYVEYMHSYCNALEPHMDELRKIEDVEELKKAILDIVNKDPDVNATHKKNKFVWLIQNKKWSSAKNIMAYLDKAMVKAKGIEVKVDDQGELVKEDLGDEEVVACGWCGEEYPKSECRHEKDLGYLCHSCEAAIKSRGETLEFIENESLKESAKKYIVRIEFSKDDIVEETFDTEKAAINYLQDQYDNWFADDENIAEEVIFPLLTNAKDHNWTETDDTIIIESLKEAVDLTGFRKDLDTNGIPEKASELKAIAAKYGIEWKNIEPAIKLKVKIMDLDDEGNLIQLTDKAIKNTNEPKDLDIDIDTIIRSW